MDISLWDIFIDFGIVSLLLVIGVILRAKVGFIQRSFMPASIIAGIIGLILGHNGFGILPFTHYVGDYPSILIAVVFASIPFATPNFDWANMLNKVGRLWSYSQVIMVLMWGLGLLFALVLLVPLFDVHKGFGLILAAGFVGGHGTAAALGSAFESQGWEEATSLAMMSATIGAIVAIAVGLMLIRSNANKGNTNYISRFEDLPEDLKTGLFKKENRESLGETTVSSILIDPIVFHLLLVLIATAAAYVTSVFGESLYEDLSIPVFSLSFLYALLFRYLMSLMKADKYIDHKVMNNIGGGATDLLIVFGITSINLTVVANNLVPFTILIIFGLIFTYVSYRFLSKLYFQEHWFEKGIFTFGWITGAVATGIALLRIVDPKLESKTLDEFGLAYIPIAPVEIALITFSPLMILYGQHWLFVLITVVVGVAILLFSYFKKWIQFGN
ncbi:MAG TPA: sodium:glutamate symporter [Pseudogracilibacillus sp.]|nr:sodium:glutamate symporter [Pseudogracilibacillus sp.]